MASGVVVSDWTAVRSLAAANAEQDLEMPGPGVWGEALVAAVRAGEVDEAAIDRHVARLLLLAEERSPGAPAESLPGGLGAHRQPVAAPERRGALGEPGVGGAAQHRREARTARGR